MTPINDNPTRAMRVVRCDETMAAVLRGERFLVFDGAMGTMLQQAGLEAGELPELLCLTNPEEITGIHIQYVEAGSEVVTANTFGANQTVFSGGSTQQGAQTTPTTSVQPQASQQAQPTQTEPQSFTSWALSLFN